MASERDCQVTETPFAAGKLRTTILHFYAQTSDHVKRLTSVTANGKFSAPDAGMNEPLSRPEALGAVVSDLRVRHTSPPCHLADTFYCIASPHSTSSQLLTLDSTCPANTSKLLAGLVLTTVGFSVEEQT